MADDLYIKVQRNLEREREARQLRAFRIILAVAFLLLAFVWA